jgi:hypothetical protein
MSNECRVSVVSFCLARAAVSRKGRCALTVFAFKARDFIFKTSLALKQKKLNCFAMFLIRHDPQNRGCEAPVGGRRAPVPVFRKATSNEQ